MFVSVFDVVDTFEDFYADFEGIGDDGEAEDDLGGCEWDFSEELLGGVFRVVVFFESCLDGFFFDGFFEGVFTDWAVA